MADPTSGPVLVQHARPRLMRDYFCLEGGDDPCDRLASSWVGVPAFLDGFPKVIRKFRVIGSGWSTSFQHREYPCNLVLIGKWKLPSENLTGKSFHLVTHRGRAKSVPTSQDRTAMAYTSVAFVAPALDDPVCCGSASSGAAPWKNLSMSTPGIGAWTRAAPSPAMRACPSRSTSMLV